eukprot:11188236-Karenia_brevis.AAC.1
MREPVFILLPPSRSLPPSVGPLRFLSASRGAWGFRPPPPGFMLPGPPGFGFACPSAVPSVGL